MYMLALSNTLSLLRAPLAFLFLQSNIYLRVSAIILAMITDCFDGYLARKAKATSKFGAVLDPVMDKFFVYFILSVLYLEGSIELWHALTLLSRDFALIIFIIYLLITKKYKGIEIKAIFWGKIATALQFVILILITLKIPLSNYLYYAFIILGFLALVELFKNYRNKKV